MIVFLSVTSSFIIYSLYNGLSWIYFYSLLGHVYFNHFT